MDPYEYLLTKLGLKICPVTNLSTDYSWDFFEDGQILGVCYGNLASKEDVCKYAVKHLTGEFSWFLNDYYSSSDYSNHFKTVMKQLHLQLAGFPEKLESVEHVDLLLTVNGMNKEA